MVIKNARLSLPNISSSEITVAGGKIEAIGSKGSTERGEVVDALGSTIFPGYIDVHNHGAVGVDVNTTDVDGLLVVAEFLAKKGVTAWMPTLVPDSDENYARVIGTIDRLMEIQSEMPIAQAVGVHYEGVFANEKMCGALRPEFFKSFTGNEVVSLPRLKRGVHMTTFAPEIEGGIELTKELTRQGWVASIGHTKAGVEILDQAFEAGARHLTHFYNAMTGLHHRDVGVVGWAFANKDVTFDIIADGIHVDTRPLEFACRAKGCDKVSLISDSVAPTGLGEGDFELWGERISVVGGRTKNERGSIAGSVITMLDAVNRMFALGFSSVEVAQMASINPARLLGIDHTHGSLQTGKRADIISRNPDGSLEFVMIGGRRVLL